MEQHASQLVSLHTHARALVAIQERIVIKVIMKFIEHGGLKHLSINLIRILFRMKIFILPNSRTITDSTSILYLLHLLLSWSTLYLLKYYRHRRVFIQFLLNATLCNNQPNNFSRTCANGCSGSSCQTNIFW